jgi:hypothetical protein
MSVHGRRIDQGHALGEALVDDLTSYSDVIWSGHIERPGSSQPNGGNLKAGQFPEFHPMTPGIGVAQNRVAQM